MFKYSSVPAYSMGPKAKGLPGSNVPGPGNYDLDQAMNKESIHPNEPKWAFPKNARGQKYGNFVPGPGQYDSVDKRKYKGGLMGGKANDARGNPNPGPGTYDGNPSRFNQSKAPAYTMRKKNCRP